MKDIMMIKFLEFVFRKTMRTYWYSARYTGRSAGINEMRAMIHAEIKKLQQASSKPMNRATTERISELLFILSESKKLTSYVD
jgi:hypothetical protein